MEPSRGRLPWALAVFVVACGSSGDAAAPGPDGGADAVVPVGGDDAAPPTCASDEALCMGACAKIQTEDSSCGAGACGVACTGGAHCVSGACAKSAIEHVVLVVQENHTFDSYFGHWCKAASGSSPTCTTGRACCEAAPTTEPGSSHAAPIVLDDSSNFATDRDHDRVCEIQQIHGGKMDQYVTGASGGSSCDGKTTASCSDANNWAVAESSTLKTYWDLADANAIADRYFQPVVGGSASNDQYFAAAHWRFSDNDHIPQVAAGRRSGGGLCVDLPSPLNCIPNSAITYNKQTIGDLLLAGGASFAVYADGYGDARDASKTQSCPSNPSSCRYSDCAAHPVACFGCVYDPSDIPFLYYASFQDPATPIMKDYEADFAADLKNGKLPSFSFVKARVWHNEHPNMSNLSDGIAFVKTALDAISASTYAPSTLVLLTWDEGGGFFDHVTPPASPPTMADADDTGNPVAYGTRVPLLAIGPFARAGTVSHSVLEHSSIVRFLEWNFLTSTGQLGARDAVVKNLGSLLDPAKTTVPVPD